MLRAFATALLFLGGAAFAAPDFSASVPASGDENFPINGQLWLFGKDLDEWPSNAVLPSGFRAGDHRPPWEKNPELRDIWREPRRVRWHEDARRARLRELVSDGEGIALVEAENGRGIRFTSEIFSVAHRPPLSRGETSDAASGKTSGTSYQLLIIQPAQDLERSKEYALVANGELVMFRTSDTPDREAPTWQGISEIRHEGENNSIYETFPVEDNSPFPARIEIYRGESDNVQLRQFALVGQAYQTGRLSPFNTGCVFAKAVDVAGNATEMLPCFEFPPLPDFSSAEERGSCSSSATPSSGALILLALVGLRGRKR
ncbi:MAG: hypothetical protein VXW32_00665 [Myxococcota bacterium]|nr:hypothetical protein [Myxococcota bacterium]